MQVEGQHADSLLSVVATGARVSNAYPTCPILENRLSKERLILYVLISRHPIMSKDLSVWDGDASD